MWRKGLLDVASVEECNVPRGTLSEINDSLGHRTMFTTLIPPRDDGQNRHVGVRAAVNSSRMRHESG